MQRVATHQPKLWVDSRRPTTKELGRSLRFCEPTQVRTASRVFAAAAVAPWHLAGAKVAGTFLLDTRNIPGMESGRNTRDRYRNFWRGVDALALLALVAYLWVLADWWTASLGDIWPAYRALILACCAGIAVISGIAWTIKAIVTTRTRPVPWHLLARAAAVVIVGAIALSPVSTPGFEHSRSDFDAVAEQIRREGLETADYSETGRGSRRIGSEEIIRITRPRDSEVYFSTTRNSYASHSHGWVHSDDGLPESLAASFEGHEIEELGGGWYRFHGWF